MKTILTTLILFTALNLSAQSDSTKVKATRCNGITKAGNQCKKLTKSKDGFCFIHSAARKEKSLIAKN